MSKKNITIYDIAKEAGVSPSTVSRVISGNIGVSEDKKKLVEAAIKKHQFVPNAMAKGLKEQRSNLIGIIVPDIKNPYYASLFYEVQLKALKEGFMVFLCNTQGDKAVELKMLRTLMNKQVEALVVIGGALDFKGCKEAYIEELQMIAEKIPVVITTEREHIDCIKVVNDDRMGMALLTQHLAQRGYQKVAFIGGNDEVIPSSDRRKYFLEYAEKNHLITKEEWIIDGGFDIRSGIEVMTKLWNCESKPDAVCGINDLVALGILNFAHKNHLSIPADIGVTGCDGIDLGETSYPGLSTIATPYEVFGKTIIDAILAAQGGEIGQKRISVSMGLIERRSTAKNK